MPSFVSCKIPAFLEGYDLDEQPLKENYADPEGSSLYKEHLLTYETTLLRKLFIDFMKANYPAWAREFEAESMQKKFEWAVSSCCCLVSLDPTARWLDEVEKEYGLQRTPEDDLFATEAITD